MPHWQHPTPQLAPHRGGDPRLAALEARLAALEKVVQVDQSGNVTINTHGRVKIKGAQSVEIEGMQIEMKADTNMKIHCNAQLDLFATAIAQLRGGLTKIGPGSTPAAKLGDHVSVHPSGGGGTIVTGEPTVLI